MLFELRPQEETPYRTPLWLILMRLLLAALVILGFAGPLLNSHSELEVKRADNTKEKLPDYPAPTLTAGSD